MPADCSAHGSSSVVSIVAPMLPQHPKLEGKFTNPSCLLFRSLHRLDCVNASKVSVSAVSRSTDVYRFDLDATASTPGSIDPIGLVRVVSGWLRDVCAS